MTDKLTEPFWTSTINEIFLLVFNLRVSRPESSIEISRGNYCAYRRWTDDVSAQFRTKKRALSVTRYLSKKHYVVTLNQI